MDPPPLPSLPTTTTTTTAAAAAAAAVTPPAAATAASIQLNYPDSVDSSPRSRNADTWVDDHLPPVPGAKLRLMCSYGGHIIPRPHDKSLCYVGGDTRIVVVDRHSSLSDLCSRLSRTLLHGRPFTLKYQLPSEDLDSLISVTTDEDLENMIDEYDRTAASSPLKPSRLRLFLFFVKPETAASMGALLDDAKSETWFVDALNGSGLLPRGLSDSAMDDCLLSLDDGVRGSDSCNDLEAQGNFLGENNKQVVGKNNVHEVQYTMPDSPILENNSSFGSSSSSPSMSNLPPIRVRVDENGARGQDQRVGMEEQFAQISYAAAPPIPAAHGVVSASGTVISVGHQVNPMFVPGENMSKVLSDDERLDHGAPVGFRKPPLPLQPVQPKAATGGYSLPSPDSVASDTSSITSACSLSKPMYYQDQLHAPPREIRGPASPDTRNNDNSDPGPGTQQAKDSGYLIAQQLDQQHHHHQQPQFAQYIHHPVAASPVHMSPYYQVYPQTPQQFHHPMDQQYPFYVMPVAPQTQPYNMSLQSNVADTTTTVAASSRPMTSMVPAPGSTYKQEGIPPVYPAKAASPALPDMAAATSAGVYKTAVGSIPSLVQIPPNQYQQAYVGYSQMHHHPSQSIAVPSSAPGNYAYEYANPAVAQHEQVYYAQHPAQAAAAAPAPLPSQYQSMTPAAAAAIALSEAAKQLPADNNAQQQIRTSQPL